MASKKHELALTNIGIFHVHVSLTWLANVTLSTSQLGLSTAFRLQ